MKWWDYLTEFVFIVFCFVFCGFLMVQYDKDQKTINELTGKVESYHEEIADLKKEIEEYEKEQRVILDCLLNHRWD